MERKADDYREAWPNKTDSQIIEQLGNEVSDKVGTIHELLKIKELFGEHDPFKFMELVKKHNAFEMIIENLLLQNKIKELESKLQPNEHTNNIDVINDWEVGDKFTTPETGDTIFTVTRYNERDVEAVDRRSRAGFTNFSKSYITKIK